MKTYAFSPCRLVVAVAAMVVIVAPARAIDPTVSKLFGRWSSTPSSYFFGGKTLTGAPQSGHQIAMSEKWIVAGAPFSSEGGISQQGAVQVFNAATNAFVRKLLPPAPTATQRWFGYSVAIWGNYALVGAPDGSGAGTGAVYVYNLSTGSLLKTLKPAPADGAAGDFFGCAVAMSGSKAVIGSYKDDTSKGSAYIFDYLIGTQLFKLTDSSGAAGEGMGFAVCADGSYAFVTSLGMNGSKGGFLQYDLASGGLIQRTSPSSAVAGDYLGSGIAFTGGQVVLGGHTASGGTGKVVTRNLLNGTERTLTASDGAAGDSLGYAVAAQNGLIVVGAPGKNSLIGQAYVFDLNSTSTTELRKLTRPDDYSALIGMSVAISGNTVVIADASDLSQGSSAGSLLAYRPILRPMPMTKLFAKGEPVPGTADASFNGFGDIYLNDADKIAFTSTLAGLGSNGGKDTALFDNVGTSGLIDLALKSRQLDGGLTIGTVSKALNNTNGPVLCQATLTGTGVTSATNQAIYLDDGTSTMRKFRAGTLITEFPAAGSASAGASPLSFLAVAQSRQTSASLFGFVCSLTNGVNGTTSTTDSGLILRNDTASTNVALREGAPSGVALLGYGQFAPRLAYYHTDAVFSMTLPGASAVNSIVLFRSGAGAESIVAQKGSPGQVTLYDGSASPTATYSSFIGESVDDGGRALFRATLTGSGVTSATNEGLWTFNSGSRRLIFGKGFDLGASSAGFTGAGELASVKIAKFIAFWQVFGQQLALVQLTGTGVTSSNDQALLLFEQSGVTNQLLVLMREGQPAPGCPGATIGVISRVDVEPYYGHYVVLATLAGAPTGTELALFRGASHLSASLATHTLRRPSMILRKGHQYENQPSKVKSITLPTKNLTAAGAGTTGLGSCLQEATSSSSPRDIVVVVDFDNGIRQVMQGKP